MQTTGNLGLKKPEGTDVVDIADLNGNADIIDAAVAGKVDKEAGKGLSANDYTAAEKTKLAGVAEGANAYVHPSTHPASIIVQDASNRFATDAEKAAWNAKASTAAATTTTAGLQSAADKAKLDGIAAGANNYTHPSTHAASMITIADAGNVITGTNVETALQEIATNQYTKISNGTNVNTLIETGKYAVSSPVNSAVGGGTWYYDVIKFSNLYVTQMCFASGANVIYTRRLMNGTWGNWSMISNHITELPADITNLNSITESGRYVVGGSTNKPIDAPYWLFLDVMPYGDGVGYQNQLARAMTDSRVWSRSKDNGNWTAWVPLTNNTINLVAGTDLNGIVQTGKYNINAYTNGPVGMAEDWVYLDVTKYSQQDNFCTQTLRAFYTNRTWERRMIGSGWTGWTEVGSSANAVGSYTGNNASSRNIALAFTPSAVWLFPTIGTSHIITGNVIAYSGLAVTGSNASGLVIGTNMFSVSYSSGSVATNANGIVYNYIAFK